MLERAQLSRLKWRSRRGMLENDLVLQSFFERHEAALDQRALAGLGVLLELPDGDLWDLIAGRAEVGAGCSSEVRDMLGLLRGCDAAGGHPND